MAVWTSLVVDAPHIASGGPRGSLVTASGRKLTLSKDDPSTYEWTMQYFQPGTKQRSAEIGLLVPRASDMIVYRDTYPLFRGRITLSEIDYDENGQVVVKCSAVSYKGMLKTRFLLDADCQRTVDSSGAPANLQRNYSASTDVGAIVWDLISITQARAYGTLGIAPSAGSSDGHVLTSSSFTALTSSTAVIPSVATSGTVWTGGNGNTGVTPSTIVEMQVGQSLFDLINTLGAGNGQTTNFGAGPIDTTGFDWDVVADGSGNLVLKMWPRNSAAGGRGRQNGYVLDFGGTVSGGSTAYDAMDFADYVRLSAGNSLQSRALGGGNAQDGLWEESETLTVPLPLNLPASISTLPTLDNAAADTYSIRSAVRPAYTVTLRRDSWGMPGGVPDTDVGDECVLNVPTLEDATLDTQRILTQTMTPGDDGGETVALTLGSPPVFGMAALQKQQQDANTAYRTLERSLFGGSG